MSWFQHLSPAVQAAVIAGAVAVLTALVTAVSTATNISLKARLDRRAAESAARELQRDLYRKYADPLTTAAESLYWRLREIFELGRSGYLGVGGGLTRFEKYKVSSTIYRLAALLGWMTALRRELSLSNAQHDRSVGPMREAVHKVVSALAEGGHVERDKATGLAHLWNISGIVAETAGQDIDLVVDRYRHENRVASVADLDAQRRSALLVNVAEALVMRTEGHGVPSEMIDATTDEAIAVLSTREAWIYRDLQEAIGDWMLRQSGFGSRRFDVMSYREFAEAERDPTGQDTVWLGLLHGVVDELDLGRDGRQDARIAQLRGVFEALANLIVQFHDAEPELSSVGETALTAVRESLANAGMSTS
jgi:hypothetical protein